MENGASVPKQGCTGNPKADAYASLGAHGVLAVTSMVPFVGCGAAIADVGLTTAEESGLLCGGELQTPAAGWRAVNMTLAITGATLSCIPEIGTIFGGVKSLFSGIFGGARATRSVTHVATEAVASASKVVKITSVAKLSKLVAAPVAKIADAAAQHAEALTEALKHATITPVVLKFGRFTGASVATTSKVAVLTKKVIVTGGKEIQALVRNVGHVEPPHMPVPHTKPAVIHDVGAPRVPHESPAVNVLKSIKAPVPIRALQFSADVVADVTGARARGGTYTSCTCMRGRGGTRRRSYGRRSGACHSRLACIRGCSLRI